MCNGLTDKYPGRQKENGNALFLILIGVVLFAALSFVLVKNWGGSTDMATEEQARLNAAEVVQYGTSLRLVIDRMIMLAGVSDTNTASNGLLFADPDANAAYGVPGAQAATELFHSAGGKADYLEPPQGSCVTACAYEFSGQYTVTGVGLDSKSELVMLLINVTESFCEKANSVAGHNWSSIPTEDTLTLTRFNGTNYGSDGGANAIMLTGAGNILAGKRAFCYRESGGGQRYIYLHVLRSR